SFGGVSIVGVHNSPAKVSPNLVTPEPCDTTVTNTATVTAKANGTPLTALDTATVDISTSTNNTSNIVAGTVTASGHLLTVPLTNNGSTDAILPGISITWPSATDGVLQNAKLAGKVVLDNGPAGIPGSPAGTFSTTTLKGTNADRT